MEEAELAIDFDGRAVVYPFGELDEVTPAFATTIHKSQGSEYPAVVVPVLTQHYTMLARNLIYTGITRGKRLVVLVGQKKGDRHGGAQCAGPAALVEAARAAGRDGRRLITGKARAPLCCILVKNRDHAGEQPGLDCASAVLFLVFAV